MRKPLAGVPLSSPVTDAPLSAATPSELVYCVGRGLDVFAPPDRALALPDGTFVIDRLPCFVYCE